MLKKSDEKRANRLDKTILGLEIIYERTMKQQRAKVLDAWRAAKKIIFSHMLLPEFYFLLLSVSLLICASGMFIANGSDYKPAQLVLLAVTSIYAGILPLALALLTVPFHLLTNTSLWLLTGLHAILTSVVFSISQPFLGQAILGDFSTTFSDLFIPMITFYSVANFFMLSRINHIQNFQLYKKRHNMLGLDDIIPSGKMGEIISMSSQDHYVEFTTENGQHLERLTLAKAMELVSETKGLHVHRSHWVACEFIKKLEKSGGRYTALLHNGSIIPVGRSKVAAVKHCLAKR